MRRIPALAMTALVILFLAEGQRALFASIFALAYDALFPAFRPVHAILSLAPLFALLAPLVPLPRWTDRAGAVGVAAAATALFRLPMTWPALETRLLGGALVLAAGATFLTWAVGHVERRALAGGAVLGLVLDQLLRLAGTSYDVSLQPGWLPVQGILTLALIGAVFAWSRAETNPGSSDPAGGGLERRAGGLRLRGGLALGALLFLDLHVVGLPSAAARWTGVSHTFAAAAVTVAGALGLLATLALGRPSRGRATALALVGILAAGPLVALAGDGPLPALAMATGHFAALLLVTRALDPASGRRSGRTAVAAFAVLVVGTALYSLTFFPSFTLPWLEGAAPWVFVAAGVLLAGCFILLPRPAELEPLPAGTAAGAAAIIAVVGGLLILFVPGRAPTPGDRGRTRPVAELRVATWNGHYGFDERWRFDPGALAATLADADVDVVALQEMVVAAPFAYGIDLPLWLGYQLGADDYFAPTLNGLLGDAFLATVRATATARPLPAAGEPKQMLTLAVTAGDATLRFHALHLGLDPDARDRQIRAALAEVPDGPSVVLGDLNAGPASTVIRQLTDAGFRDAFASTPDPPPTFPARAPTRRIDWIWTRGLDVTSATVPESRGSDHRPVVAIVRPPPRDARERGEPGGS